MISVTVRLVGQLSDHMWQKLSCCDFVIHPKYDKLCQILHDGLIELYPFKPYSVTLIVFQGHSNV